MALPGFIFGGDTGIHSPEELARARAYAEALLGPQRPAQNVGEGLAVLGQAIRGRREMNAVNKASAAGDASASSAVMAALGGNGPFPAAPSGGAKPSAADYADTRVRSASGDSADSIKQGLVSRGMNPQVADAFVMNFQDESGLNPGVNEKAPVVPGSRGGFGLAQWTGPRRRALEAYAAQQGKPVGDQDTQLDFLMSELHGPEAAAWQDIQAAPDTGHAAAAVVNKFLRPAEEHRVARESRYLRANPVQVASNDPSAGVAQALGGASPAPASPVSAALQLPAQGPIPQARPDVAAALNGVPQLPNPGPGDPAASTPAGQRVLGQMMSPLPMGGNAMQMQPAAGAAPAPAPQAAPQQAQPNLDQIPVEAGGNAGAVQPGGLPSVQQLMQAAQNPWLKPEQRQLINGLLQQQMQNQDPLRQLQIKAAQKSLDIPPKQWQKLDDNTLFDPASGEVKQIGGGGPTEFKGTGLDAQAWNILQTADPGSKEYATAYSIVSQPKTQLVQTENGMMPVEVPPQLPGWLKAPGSVGAPVAAPAGAGPAQSAAPAAAQPGADAGVIPGTKKPPTEMQARNGAIGKILLNEVPTLGKTFGALADPKGQLLNAIPGGLGNAWQSEDYQRAAASVKTSIANVLYSLSGASSNPGEVLKQIEVLTPAFGDKPGTIADKLNRFKTYVRSVSSEANDPELTKSVEDALKQMEGTAEAPQKDIKEMSDDELKAIIDGN